MNRADRAGRYARGHLRAAALGVRRPLHRHDQHPKGQGARDRRVSFAAVQLRVTGDLSKGRRWLRSGSASTRSRFWRGAGRQEQRGSRQGDPASYLGSPRDYLVETAGGDQIRVVTAADGSIAQGYSVWLRFPPEHCRAPSDDVQERSRQLENQGGRHDDHAAENPSNRSPPGFSPAGAAFSGSPAFAQGRPSPMT